MTFGMTSVAKRLAFAFFTPCADNSGISFGSFIAYSPFTSGARAEVPLAVGAAAEEEANNWFAAVVVFSVGPTPSC
jgi:hypothetical protein